MNYRSLMGWAGVIGLVVGCGSARDVDVSGDVSDPDALAGSDSVVVAFYEREEPVDEESTEGELAFVHTVALDSAGTFEEVVPIAGEKLYAIAFVDGDGDEACTDGEPWGDAEVTIGEDDTANVSMQMQAASACPSVLPADE